MSLLICNDSYKENLDNILKKANWHSPVEYDWDLDKEVPVENEWEKGTQSGYNKFHLVETEEGSFFKIATYNYQEEQFSNKYVEKSFIKINVDNVECISFDEEHLRASIHISLKNNMGSIRIS